jgi:hypothetical protein
MKTSRRGPGRPSLGAKARSHNLIVRVSPAEVRGLKTEAKRRGVTVSELVLRPFRPATLTDEQVRALIVAEPPERLFPRLLRAARAHDAEAGQRLIEQLVPWGFRVHADSVAYHAARNVRRLLLRKARHATP